KSRTTQRRGVSGEALNSMPEPLRKNLTMSRGSRCGRAVRTLCSATMPRSRSKLFPTPDDAETAFYDAFERADVAAMMAVWAESDDIVCIHPQGPRLAGFEAVRESWAQIFAGGAQLRVRTTEERRF